MTILSRIAIATIGTLLTTLPVSGQNQRGYSVAAIVGTANRESAFGDSAVQRTGATIGLEGHFTLGPVRIEGRYLQGGITDNQDIIEGELLAGIRPLSWAMVKFGPHARSFIVDEITERWTFWETRFRVDGEVFAPQSQSYGVQSYFEIWFALGGTVNLPSGFGSGKGAEAGLQLQANDVPLMARIGYRIDRGNVSSGLRRDTIQELILAFGIGR